MGITRQQALDCMASDDLIGLGMEADAARRALHPDAVVTYTLEHVLDCTPADLGLVLSTAAEAVQRGAATLHLPANSAAKIAIGHYEAILLGIKARLPQVKVTGFSATAILALADSSGSSLKEVLQRLHAAGLALLTSHALVLEDGLRSALAPGKCSAAQWLEVHRTAHALGMPSVASMVFGAGETVEQRVQHLELLRDLQQETGGFTEFVPLVYERENPLQEPTAVEYLKTLAVSRLYLDNVPHLQASWEAQGLKVLQMALRFGANDAGSIGIDAGQVGTTPARTEASEEELRRIIREAGMRPVQRDASYGTLYLT